MSEEITRTRLGITMKSGYNVILLVCIAMLVLPSESVKHNATIHDYTVDAEMLDQCSKRNYTEYCRNQVGVCEPGTHIMCMYYRSGMVMGPQCESGKMVKMNQGIRNTILDEVRQMREEVVNGRGRGKGDKLLPVAYNLKTTLIWDDDLATFAQVWTNQCTRSHDFCRATTKFSNPGQFVGVDIFTHPDWKNIRTDEMLLEIEKKCLTPHKIKQAVIAIMRLMKNAGKPEVTGAMIKNFQGAPRNVIIYLMMLNQYTTHIGCGLSHYLEYKWLPDTKKHDVSILQLVCNLSAQPIIGNEIYDTNRPPDFFRTTFPPTPNGLRDLTNNNNGPGILIMPIITVEDVPVTALKKHDLDKSKGNQQPGPPNSLRSARKSSIFSRAPIFNLSGINHNNTSNATLQDKVFLKNKIKTILAQVPRKDIPRLRELLKDIVKKHKSEENHVSTLGPVEVLETAVSETKGLISSKPKNDPPNIINDKAGDESLRLRNRQSKFVNRERFIGDVRNYNYNQNIKDGNIIPRKQSQFDIPLIRKVKPIGYGTTKKSVNQSNNDITLVDDYRKTQENNYNAKNDKIVIDSIPDKSKFENNGESLPIHNDEENKINDHQSIPPMNMDHLKLKRRLYLENEITKLKRKLKNLRQYITDNEENARIRPQEASHSGHRTTKFDEKRNFYMPDRAHPLHEFK